MTTPSQNAIHILLVNDESADLEHYKDTLDEQCDGRLCVHLYGPEQAGSKQVGRRLLEVLLATDAEGQLPERIDVLFVDYRMPDINGLAFLRLLRKSARNGTAGEVARIPVVVMTKYEDALLAKLDSGVETGVAGYVFTDRDLLWLDVEATAKRVFQEAERERWAEALMDISSRVPTVNGRQGLCALITGVMDARCPTTTMFMREFDGNGALALIGASSNIPQVERRRLQVLARDRFPMLKAAADGNILFYNSLSELDETGILQDDLDLCRRLHLDRGMSFPLRDPQGAVFGTICMYRGAVAPPFTYLERSYADLMSRHVAGAWTARKERQQGLAYAHFLADFTRCEDEDEVFRKLVQHLHAEINEKAGSHGLTKTTFKLLAPGSDRLVCRQDRGHHLGVPRDSDFCPSIFSKQSISAWTARENTPRIIVDYEDEADYSSTNRDMVSELCIPVAGAHGDMEPVIGVLNMECSERGFYTEEDMEYAEALCRQSGYFADRLRTRSFLGNVLRVLGRKGSREELVDRSVELIRQLTGSRLLLFIVRDAARHEWRVMNVDTPLADSDAGTIRQQVETLLNAGEGKTLLEGAVIQNKDEYYEPDILCRSPDSYYVPSGILRDGERLRSQAVFMMRAGETVVGALSLEFVITNPLSPGQRELLGYFARWLGKLILQDDSLKDLSERVEILDGMRAFADMLSRVWHSSEGQLYSLRNLCEACLHECAEGESDELCRNLEQLRVGIEQISGLPSRIAALAREPELGIVDVSVLWREVTEELAAKAQHLRVLVTQDQTIATAWADADILKMILYHLIDNALDACVDQPERRVSLRADAMLGGRVAIRVSDSGKGILEDEMPLVMQLNYTTKPHGTGYGLFWVKQRVGDMQGEVKLKSAGAGTGTTVSVLLPTPRDTDAGDEP